jgi:uncharacterized protein (DUF362 family)
LAVENFTQEGEEKQRMPPRVVVQKLASDSAQLDKQFERSFGLLALEDDFAKSRAILIKPNLTYPSYKKGVVTRIEFVDRLVAALRKINSSTRIYIGEGEGGYNAFSMSDGMRVLGYYDLESRYPNVKVVNLSKLSKRQVELRAKSRPYSVDLPALFFEEIDFSITCPLPKVHCMTTLSLSFKNQWGCLSDTMRLKNHHVFDETIGQVCDKLKFRYAFLDGKYGLDQNGPMMGVPVEVDWFVASNSLGAFDVVVSDMMGFDWKKIGHLKKASEYGFVPEKNQIMVVGEYASLKRTFVLHRSFWNYPALAAFRSRKLTHLFYLSKISKLLHTIMYIFRKKPIEE